MGQAIISGLAVGMALLAAPLFLDLTLCLAGNFFPVRGPRKAARRQIRLAAVVPAHDEDGMIARAVASLRTSDAATPIYVVAHNCTDGTAKAAGDAGARVLELSDPTQRGKGAALRHGFAAALARGANAVLVVDADTVVSPNLIAATRDLLERGADATQCRYELAVPGVWSLQPMTRLRALAFRGMNVMRARGRAGLGFSTGLFGNGFALTAATLEQVPYDANSIAEDVEYHTLLAAHGVPVSWLGDAFVHAPVAGKAQALQEARWEGGRLGVAVRATRELLACLMRGRLRAVETLIDVWSLPLSRGILLLLFTVLLAVHWLHVFALVCGLIALLYGLQAALMGDEPLRDLAALAAAPVYLVWKAMITPLVLRQSRRRAEWARIRREAPQP